ncbi:MAG TPA: DUF5615 family PIN-like protein [Acidobacteriota bacterium]|nr:DUF5615 family PIN-like protein [Acidobacteriota bacterium]
MSRLFASLYLDEDVSIVIAEILRSRGFDVATVRDRGKLGLHDEQQLRLASSENRVLVTHNRVDFERLATEWFSRQETHSGIVVATRRQPGEVSRRLLELLDRFTADEWRNQILYI